MIFNKEYDNSLYYMMKAKDIGSLRAMKLVSELPEEFVEKIRSALYDYEFDYDTYKKIEPSFFSIHSKLNPNIKYTFNINGGDLDITKYKVRNGIEKQVSSVNLSPTDPEKMKNSKSDYGYGIGIFSTGAFPTLNYIEKDYFIVNTKLGSMFCFHYCFLCNLIEIKLYQPVRIKDETVEMFRKGSNQRKRLLWKNK